jgi:hypothetical protein
MVSESGQESSLAALEAARNLLRGHEWCRGEVKCVTQLGATFWGESVLRGGGA